MPKPNTRLMVDNLVTCAALCGALLGLVLLIVYIGINPGSGDAGDNLLFFLLVSLLLAWLVQTAFTAYAIKPISEKVYESRIRAAAFEFYFYILLIAPLGAAIMRQPFFEALRSEWSSPLFISSDYLVAVLSVCMFSFSIATSVGVFPGIAMIFLCGLVIPFVSGVALMYVWHIPALVAIFSGLTAGYFIATVAQHVHLWIVLASRGEARKHEARGILQIGEASSYCRILIEGSKKNMQTELQHFLESKSIGHLPARENT